MSSNISIQLKTDNDEMIELCEKYWEYNDDTGFKYKVNELSKKNKIPVHKLPKVVTAYCDAYIENYLCSNCHKPYYFKSRSDYTQS